MKHNTILFSGFFMLVFSNFICSEKLKQEFTVQNFRLTNDSTSYTDSAGVRFMYNVKLKHFIENKPTWKIYTELYTNDSSIYKSRKPNTVSIYSSEKYWDSIYDNLEAFIPYDQINLPKGKHKVKLQLIAVGNENAQAIFSKELEIDIPELFNYEEQKLNITDYKFKDKNNEISIDINFDLKFKSFQTRGFYINKSLQYCYIKVNLYDKKTGKQIQYISRGLVTEKVKTNTITDKNCSFSIPYENLKLKPGKYDVICKILLSDKNYKDLAVMYEDDFLFTLPQLYEVDLNMKSLALIREIKYDPTSITAQIFSRKDKGKGYPDVYWMVKAAGEIKYTSITNKNSFTGIAKEISFIIENSDMLRLSVLDYDLIGGDDLIGSMKIINDKEEFDIKYKEETFGNVRCNFDFSKRKYEPWK